MPAAEWMQTGRGASLSTHSSALYSGEDEGEPECQGQVLSYLDRTSEQSLRSEPQSLSEQSLSRKGSGLR